MNIKAENINITLEKNNILKDIKGFKKKLFVINY